MITFFTKDDPAINEHHYHITKLQYNEYTHNTYNADKTKSCNIKHNIYIYTYIYIYIYRLTKCIKPALALAGAEQPVARDGV